MKQHLRIYSTSYLAVGVALILSACQGNSSITGPDTGPLPPVLADPTPAPAEQPTGNPGVDAAPAAPTVEIIRRGETWVFRVNSPTRQRFVVASYNDPDRNIETQTLHNSRAYDFVGTHDLEIGTPCLEYQVDVFVGISEAPEPPVNVGNITLIGRIGRNECEPPPPQGCQTQLKCELAQLDATAITPSSSRALSCNHPVVEVSTNAASSSVSGQSWYGSFAIKEAGYVGDVKLAIDGSPKCTYEREFEVPGDPCINARLSVTISGPRLNDSSATFTVNYSTTQAAVITWGDGSSSNVNGTGSVSHTYQRGDSTKVYNILVKSRCRQLRLNAKVPSKPTCEQLNPRTLFSGSGSSRVVNRTPFGKRVNVNGAGQTGGKAFSGKVGILWRKGNSKYVKTYKSIGNRCGQRSGEVSLSWTSTSSSHTSCSARYSVIFYTNNSRSNPNILKEIQLRQTGICSGP